MDGTFVTRCPPRGDADERGQGQRPATAARAQGAAGRGPTPAPGRSSSVEWLAAHLDDPDLRVVHVAPDRRVYNKRHIAGATYSDLHKELALKGTAPETGDAEREWLVPDAEQVEARPATLAGRRGRPGRLLRRHRAQPPGHPRLLAAAAVPVPDGPPAHPRRWDRGLAARRSRRRPPTIPEPDLADGLREPVDARRARRRRSSRPTTRSSPGAARLPGAGRPDADPRRPDRGRVGRHGPASQAWRPHPGRPAPLLRRPADRGGDVPAGRRDGLAGPRLAAPTPTRSARPIARAASARRSSGSSSTSWPGSTRSGAMRAPGRSGGTGHDSPIDGAVACERADALACRSAAGASERG